MELRWWGYKKREWCSATPNRGPGWVWIGYGIVTCQCGNGLYISKGSGSCSRCGLNWTFDGKELKITITQEETSMSVQGQLKEERQKLVDAISAALHDFDHNTGASISGISIQNIGSWPYGASHVGYIVDVDVSL